MPQDEALKLHNTDFTISAWGYLTDTITTNGGTDKYYSLLGKREYAQSADNYLLGITNQSGIARGYHTQQECDLVHTKIEALLERQGVRIHKWYVCN